MTKENITLLLSCIGVIGSFSSWFYIWITQRRNLAFRVLENHTTDSHLFYILFENRSRLPISITNIAIILNGKKYYCQQAPSIALEESISSGKNIVYERKEYTAKLPIVLGSLCATSEYIFFDTPLSPEQTFATQVTLSICTNRGKEFQRTLPLSGVLVND